MSAKRPTADPVSLAPGLFRAAGSHKPFVCHITRTGWFPPSGWWQALRRPMLRRVGREEHDEYGDDDIEVIDRQTNLVGRNTEAHRAPSAFWALGLGRLHILEQEHRAEPSANPSVPNRHTPISTRRPPFRPPVLTPPSPSRTPSPRLPDILSSGLPCHVLPIPPKQRSPGLDH